jgi:hypothetical protein
MKRAGMLYREVWRQNRGVAIYCTKGRGKRIEYEVFKVQILPAEEINDKSYPLRESFPKNSEWGWLGFTYTKNSHRDPLAAALAEARSLLDERVARNFEPALAFEAERATTFNKTVKLKEANRDE